MYPRLVSLEKSLGGRRGGGGEAASDLISETIHYENPRLPVVSLSLGPWCLTRKKTASSWG